MLEELVQQNTEPGIDPLFYLCGPPSLMRMAQFTLKTMGYEDHLIRKEHFTVEFVPPPPLVMEGIPRQVRIDLYGKHFSFVTKYPKTILQSALDRQIQLPYSCRAGRCSTCMAKCIEGRVKMSINEVLNDEDLKKGLVLTCVGYAETDLHLRFSE